MARRTKPSKRRRPLSRDLIVRAALRLIDRGGLEAFSMHKLGAALGCQAMSLYHHVAGRGELLDAVAGLLMAEVELPSEGPPWDERLRAFAASYRKVALKHPRAFVLLATRPINGPQGWAMLDANAAIFRSAGFDPEISGKLVLLLGCYCNGALLAEIAGTPARLAPTPLPTAGVIAELAKRYPHLAEVAPHASLAAFGPHFTYGVESIVGVARGLLRVGS
jgi:AcrR family transcriptional regulator